MNIKKINKEEFGKILLPQKIGKLKIKKEIEKLLEKVYFNNINYYIIANLFILSQIISIVLYILVYEQIYIQFANTIDSGLVQKYIVILITYFILSTLTYFSTLLGYLFVLSSKYQKIQSEIEKDLPEFIDSLVSNLKGGLSLEKSMLKSVRPQQKALLKEVTLINQKNLMGKTTLEALEEFRKRYNSEILSRTIFLIEEGIKGGGNLAKPLERISQNLKRLYELNDEIKGNSSGFAVVIQVISIIIAPLLFALAITLLTFIGNLFSLLAEAETGIISASGIPPEFKEYLRIFSYSMIILITFFSSLITSQLKNEKTYEAVKYLPFYIVIAVSLYLGFSKVLLNFFGSII